MRCAWASPSRSRTAVATARPAFSIKDTAVVPAAKAFSSRLRISSAVTSFIRPCHSRRRGSASLSRCPAACITRIGGTPPTPPGKGLLRLHFCSQGSQKASADQALYEVGAGLVVVDFSGARGDDEGKRYEVAVGHAHLRLTHL